MTARTFIIAAAAAALAAGPVHGQERAERQWYEPETGRVWTGSGWLTIETVDQALGILAANPDVAGPVRDIMDGTLLSLTEAERADLADRLGKLILADTTKYGRVGWPCYLHPFGSCERRPRPLVRRADPDLRAGGDARPP